MVGRLEPTPYSLALAGRLVAVFRAVVEAFMRPMLSPREYLLDGRHIAGQLIRDDDPWFSRLPFHQMAQERLGRSLVASCLEDNVQHHPIGIDDETYRARIGYNLAYAHWGCGLATEAVRALVGLGFAQLNLNRIEATTNLDNTGSMCVLAKVGFTEEGILRDNVYWREVGAFYDARMYSLLRREYAG
jgi:RimJ/RimL family protein N-acetyltransferase